MTEDDQSDYNMLDQSKTPNHNKSRYFRSITDLVAEKGQEIMDENSNCLVHQNQPLAAYVSETRTFLCQQCLFEGDYEEPAFITQKARQISDTVHRNFEKFHDIQDQMKTIQPQATTQQIAKDVKQYFAEIRQMVDEAEHDTMQKIKHSKKLQLYLAEADSLGREITPDMIDVVNEEVQTLDQKLAAQKYAYIIYRENFYDKLDDELATLNADAQARLIQLKELQSSIMKIQWNEGKLRKQLSKIVNQQVLFDFQEFFVKDNKLMCVNFQKETSDEKLHFNHQYYAKCVESYTGDLVTVIGGQTKPITGKGQYELLNSIQNYQLDKKGVLVAQKVTQSLSLPRVNFAALRMRNGQLLVTGGMTAGNTVSKSCELVGSPRIPEMKHARMAHSMCDRGDYIYVFGGQGEKKTLINSVERIKVNEDGEIPADAKWETVGQMLKPAANVGLFVLGNGTILVFGGKSFNGSLKDVYYFGVKHSANQTESLLQLKNEDSFPHASLCQVHSGQPTSQYLVGNEFVHKFSFDASGAIVPPITTFMELQN